MAKAGTGDGFRSFPSTCPGDAVEPDDLVQSLINKFDSEDTMTSKGAAGVDEDIVHELMKRGHATKKTT